MAFLDWMMVLGLAIVGYIVFGIGRAVYLGRKRED